MDQCNSLRLDFKSLLLYTGNPNRNDRTRWSTRVYEAGEGELYSGSCWTGKHSEGSWSAPALKVRCNFSVFKNGYVWVKFIKGFWFDHVPHLSYFKYFKLAVPFSDNDDSISATSLLFAFKSISTTDLKTFCYLIVDQSSFHIRWRLYEICQGRRPLRYDTLVQFTVNSVYVLVLFQVDFDLFTTVDWIHLLKYCTI